MRKHLQLELVIVQLNYYGNIPAWFAGAILFTFNYWIRRKFGSCRSSNDWKVASISFKGASSCFCTVSCVYNWWKPSSTERILLAASSWARRWRCSSLLYELACIFFNCFFKSSISRQAFHSAAIKWILSRSICQHLYSTHLKGVSFHFDQYVPFCRRKRNSWDLKKATWIRHYLYAFFHT